jgi:7,8-dihydroneopterin aldolase/epimerase/oxygenase
VDSEWIEIKELAVRARIGVPDSERRTPQELRIDVRYQIDSSFRDLADRLDSTIDYAAVAKEIAKLVSQTEYRLVETLVAEAADLLMKRFPMRKVEVEIKKFALPEAGYVSARSARERNGSDALKDQ